MSQPFFYKKNSKGDPIVGSNIKATKKPSSAHVQIANIINAPVTDAAKVPFSSGNRFFVQMGANGEPVRASLIKSSVVPEGNYLEVFKNRVITLPMGAEQNSGYIPDSEEDLASVDMILSENFILNGGRSSVIV